MRNRGQEKKSNSRPSGFAIHDQKKVNKLSLLGFPGKIFLPDNRNRKYFNAI